MFKYYDKVLLIFCSLGAFNTLSAQETEAEPPTQANPPQPVNLNGLAKLKYIPAKERYDDWQAISNSWSAEFLLLVNGSGQPTYCEPARPNIPAEISTRLCADLITNAKVDILARYHLGGREGIVAVSKEPVTQLLQLRPANKKFDSPFSFALIDLGSTEFLDYAPLSVDEAEGIENDPTKMNTPPFIPRYPVSAMTERSEGTTNMVIGVGMDGAVQSCRPFQTAGSMHLDRAACKYVLETISFAPMQGVDAAEAPFYHGLPITWRIKK